MGPAHGAHGPGPWGLSQHTQKSRMYPGSILQGYSKITNVSGHMYPGIQGETLFQVRTDYPGQCTM